MIKRDYHVHTLYCDGKASAEDMVLAAIEKGMEEIGFSGHAYTSRDESWCMSVENTKKYENEIKHLQEKYAGKINILLGAEQDYFSDGDLSFCDYRIGSVHYVELGGRLCPIDDDPEDHKRFANEYFDGDLMAFAECYFETVGDVLAKTGADIIGHFNLIEKFNENDCMYDTRDPKFTAAWKKAVDRLIPYGKPFEINTGAISRGYRTQPYPSTEMMEYIAQKGGSFILSSDSHNTGTLLFKFDEMEAYVRSHGYKLLGQNPCVG